MLHLEGESATYTAATAVPPVSYENHDLFYYHYEYDPLLYFAEYNQNNPIQQMMIGNAHGGGNTTHHNDTRNDNDIDIDIDIDTLLMLESEELQIRKGSFHQKNSMNTSLSSLEPISESDTEEDEEDAEEEEEEDTEEQECH